VACNAGRQDLRIAVAGGGAPRRERSVHTNSAVIDRGAVDDEAAVKPRNALPNAVLWEITPPGMKPSVPCRPFLTATQLLALWRALIPVPELKLARLSVAVSTSKMPNPPLEFATTLLTDALVGRVPLLLPTTKAARLLRD
jgi:hypothetical protein